MRGGNVFQVNERSSRGTRAATHSTTLVLPGKVRLRGHAAGESRATGSSTRTLCGRIVGPCECVGLPACVAALPGEETGMRRGRHDAAYV
ncbi:hypothetical protein E2C01_090691 [Portunus trituberculatus]|uniref:Uncharacterized protein n=1 Tax=Portunus trituberculatus TaxID=210409 RepID=A0A5B7JQS9_PORTR|nr:hypothetical protein [Portunus trituberculatus]